MRKKVEEFLLGSEKNGKIVVDLSLERGLPEADDVTAGPFAEEI